MYYTVNIKLGEIRALSGVSLHACSLYPVVFDTIEEYAPGFRRMVVGKEVLTPPDLERIFGLTGGVRRGSLCVRVCLHP